MPERETPAAAPLAAFIDDDHPPRPDDARALLDECAATFLAALAAAARSAIEGTDDLFETFVETPESDIQNFRHRRGDWQERFERTLGDLVHRRLAGTRRKGRRPDADVSAATLRVLSAFDQERQAAIVRAAARLAAAARRESAALDRRVGLLLAERPGAETDNPFGVAYVLDAIGATSRAIYPNPRVWRPLMGRLLEDLAAPVVKSFITLNRHLADRGVLPEIKAALRARSDLRPADDSELLPLFERMLKDSAPVAAAVDVAVPSVDELGNGAAPLQFATRLPAAPAAATAGPANGPAAPAAHPALATVPVEVARTLYAAYARYVERGAAAPQTPVAAGPADEFAFPVVDSMLALGDAGAMIAELDRWQRFDPEPEFTAPAQHLASAAGTAPVGLPLNRLPLIRQALAAKIANPADAMTMDVVALIFDYIFRDPSIPDAQRRVFARLQVPIAKAALLDRSFFTQRSHPARRLLDDLAAAAVGAQGNPDYQREFEALSASVVERICEGFHTDLDVFESADAAIRPLVEREHAASAQAADPDIGDALAAEASDADRARVRSLLRDRLAGLDVPFEIRSFTETVWADHLAAIHAGEGVDSPAWRDALATLDDLLWSISAKERNAQKSKLTRMIPSLVRRLRAGVAALGTAGERVGGFFESLYRLHIEVLRPPAEATAAAAAPARRSAAGAPRAAPAQPAIAAAPSVAESTVADTPPPPEPKPAFDQASVHDFVTEMAIGTWVMFRDGEAQLPARLFWVSPLRTRYIFTTRGRGRALALTPEELAWQLGAGQATLIVEPVPLFDRAVSAALDTLAAQSPPAAAG